MGSKYGLVPVSVFHIQLSKDDTYLPERLETAALKRRPVPVLQGVNDMEFIYFCREERKKRLAMESANTNLSAYTRQLVTEQIRDSYHISFWDNPSEFLFL